MLIYARYKKKKRNTKRKRGGMDRPIARSGAQEPSGSGDDDAEHNNDDTYQMRKRSA